MDKAKEFSIGFLENHPLGAVSVLETLSPGDAAAYLKDVPKDVAGKVLNFMQPLSIAAILPKLSADKAATLLTDMDVHARTRVMRLVDDSLMSAIMDAMPKGAAKDITKFLKYPEGSVGSWMSSDMAVFEESISVEVCLNQLRALPERVRSPLFVIDKKRKFIGAIELADLLIASDEAIMGDLVDTGIRRLSPLARLSTVVTLDAWDSAHTLPVVGNRGLLLGALHFDRLRDGLTHERRVEERQPVGRLVAHMAEALLVCAAGALHGARSSTPLARPIGDLEKRS
jgi:magnesium transporter